MGVHMQAGTLEKYDTIRTTVTLPASLLRRSQELVDAGRIPNRNALIIAALEQFIAAWERDEIDRQFMAMADDADYQALQANVAESFAESDWEALAAVEHSAP